MARVAFAYAHNISTRDTNAISLPLRITISTRPRQKNCAIASLHAHSPQRQDEHREFESHIFFSFFEEGIETRADPAWTPDSSGTSRAHDTIRDARRRAIMSIDRLVSTLTLRPSSTEEAPTSLRIGSGPGAPMFEQSKGPHTRIRRAPVRAFASLSWEGGPREIFGQVLNISPGGCLLKTESTIAIGCEVSLSITVLGTQKERCQVDLVGVVRRRTEQDGRRAYGVEFSTPTREDRDHAQWLYAHAMGC